MKVTMNANRARRATAATSLLAVIISAPPG
jgi:hypothetical protein